MCHFLREDAKLILLEKRSGRLAAALLLIAASATAQGLAAETELLARIRSHMREEFSHVTNYTCLESTARFHAEAAAQGKTRSKLGPLDTVRLGIVYTNHREWYSSPGDRSFSLDNPVAFIGGGMIGNGFFAMTINNLFLSDEATFTYRGKQDWGARVAYQYDFRLPRLGGGLKVSLFGGVGTVGEEGSFWADGQSLDLIRVVADAVEIPTYLPLNRMTLSVNYARALIGGYRGLLAQAADLYMLKTTGEEYYNHLEYTHCHEFSAESSLRFDAESEPATAPPPTDGAKVLASDKVSAVAPFLPITLRLTTPITDGSAVGTLIEARVAGNVLQKGKIVVPDGPAVRGQIRRMDQYKEGADFIVGLEFTEASVDGGTLRFYADFLKMDPRPGIRPSLSETTIVKSTRGFQVRPQTITLPELPGVASFFVHGRPFTIASGFRTYWRTRGLTR
jgi:hypothetical protein